VTAAWIVEAVDVFEDRHLSPPASLRCACQINSGLMVLKNVSTAALSAHRDTDVVSREDLGLAQENDRLRRENRILKEEREILKKATQFFANQKL